MRSVSQLNGARMSDDTGRWLKDLGLERYAEAFAENEIDFDALPYLTEDDLKDIGVALGARHKLLATIAALDSGDNEVSPTPNDQAAPMLSGEHRQVTVFFADLAGFTRLSGELGAEATHALLNRDFEIVDGIVEGYGGSIDTMT